MRHSGTEPLVTICVLTFGDYPALAKRALDSILQFVERPCYRIVVGANAVGEETRRYLHSRREQVEIDHLVESDVNLGKCPMMRRMFEHVATEFVWWFDDDSYVTSAQALADRLRIAKEAPAHVVMWGEQFMCEDKASFCRGDPVAFVRSATWYRGLTPPFWKPGGKGELNFGGKPGGDGRWIFLAGGGWFIRAAALFAVDWPDRRLLTFGDDVFLGEAIRQQGWEIRHIGKRGMEISSACRRWNPEEEGLIPDGG